MFQSVIEERGAGAGRLGTGMLVSMMLHAGLVAGVLALSGKAAVEALPKELTELTMLRAIPQPPRGNPNPPAVAAQPKPRTVKPKPRRKELVQPTVMPPKPVEVDPPANTEPEPVDDTQELPYVPGSHPDGVEEGGVPGMPYVAGMALGNALALGSGEEIVDFGAGMTPPVRLSGPPIQYTREALAARVQGLLIARCVVTQEGRVQDCRIIRGLPHMDGAVLQALTHWRYRPVHYQGKPVSVKYTFNIRLDMP